MIFGHVGRSCRGDGDAAQLVSALSLYGGDVVERRQATSLRLMAANTAVCGAHGPVDVVLYGWIDNADELARDLRVSAENIAAIYAAAIARWGKDADSHVIGCYAAIASTPDGSLRCARSAWEAPPLHYAVDQDRALVSTLLRCLFAAGVPKVPDRERIIDELAIDRRAGDNSGWYRGTARVPLGGIVRLVPGRATVESSYNPPVPGPGESYNEEETVEEALRLLDEAGECAMRWARKPALSLSGGLDSTLAGSALVRALEPGRRLHAITWVPCREWGGHAPAGKFGDESSLAGEFVAAHPQVDWHRTGQDVGAFDRMAREVFSAMECFAPGLANTGMHHDVFATARSLGCDAVLTADMGNATFSEAGEAAYREYPRRGDWGQYLQLMRARPNDPRPLWRRIAALSVLPALPGKARTGLRGLIHPARRDMAAHFSALSPGAWREQRQRAAARGSQAAWADFTYDRDRSATVQRHWDQADGVQHDVNLAFEQVHGIRRRDVTAYRPLIEFCMRLPTRAFAWEGRERRLARLMGERRLPAAIHANLLYGQHNVDWHERLGRDRARLETLFRAAADHPLLGEILDIERIIALLNDWPDRPGWDWDNDMPRFMVVTRALMAVRFIGAIEGRNEL